MPATRSVTALEAFLWAACIVVLVVLVIAAMASGVPPILIAIFAILLTRLQHSTDDFVDDDEVVVRPAISSGTWTPVLPRAVDWDHAMWERWLDG